MYSPDSYNHVIRRGFTLFSVAMLFIITSAIIKAGVLFSVTPLSSTLKIETTEMIIKCLLGVILIGNFFTISGTMFKANNMIVNLIYTDIKQPVDLSSYGPDLNGDLKSKVSGDRIKMDDMAENQSSLGKIIIDFATIGLSIWWEVFYLQRFLFISILVILAPLWISMMFYPMLQGITMAAFKELWSQIVAQAVHAGLFWLFFNIFDHNLGWFHVTVAMALFIPISESVRFIFGATSQTGSKLTALGTAAGMGAFLHIGQAAKDVKGGLSTIRERLAGGKTGGSTESAGINGSMGSSQSVMSKVGGMDGAGRASGGVGGSIPSSGFASKMRLAGSVTGAVSKGAMRFAGSSMGIGLGPLGQFAFAEAGAAVGQAVGYRTGAAAVAVGKGAQSWAKNTSEHFNEGKEERATIAQDPRFQNASPVSKAIMRSAPVVGAAAKSVVQGLKGGALEKNDRALQRASAEKFYGAISEVIGGEGGYRIGERFAKWSHAGEVLPAQSFTPNQKVFSVETRDGSFLATQGESGQFNRISNINKGNQSLAKGQVVAKAYSAYKENGQPFALKPMMQPSEVRPGMLEEVPAITFDSEGQQIAYAGPTVNPSDFLEKGRPSSHVDIRRRNVNIPSLQNVKPRQLPSNRGLPT
jgi:hypothetical protein